MRDFNGSHIMDHAQKPIVTPLGLHECSIQGGATGVEDFEAHLSG